MNNFKNYKVLSLVIVCVLLFSSNVFAATNNSTDSCIDHKTILVSADGTTETVNNDIIDNSIKTTRGALCCEPNSPKTRIKMFAHYYYNTNRCDWKSTDYNKCNWCGALWYISSTQLTTHRPGSGYYCPY